MDNMKGIREVSERFHVSARTLRYYEEIGILESHRINSKYRKYDEGQIERLELILMLRRLSFGIQDIERLLSCEGIRFEGLLEKKIQESDFALLEIREANQLLKSFKSMASDKGLSEISVSEIIKDFSYITKQTERVISIIPPQAEKNRIAIGVNMIGDIINEDAGNLVNKIRQLRLLMETDSKTLPKIRIYDSPDIENNQVLIVLDDKEIMRKNYDESSRAGCGDEIVDKIKDYYGCK